MTDISMGANAKLLSIIGDPPCIVMLAARTLITHDMGGDSIRLGNTSTIPKDTITTVIGTMIVNDGRQWRVPVVMLDDCSIARLLTTTQWLYTIRRIE